MKKQKNIPVLHEVMERQKYPKGNSANTKRIYSNYSRYRQNTLYEKNVMIEHIKNQKHSDFIQRLSKESIRINEENLRLVGKLNRATISVSSRSKRPLSLTSLSYSVKRNRSKEIAKENSRIFHKLNNSCPFVNTQKINEEYQKTRKIGDRLRKYDQSCELKTKKYMKTSTISASGSIRMSAPATIPTRSHQQNIKFKPKIASFYNKEDILKNKVEHRGIPSAKILLTTIQARQKASEQKYYEFFNTQVNNNPQIAHA